jgi:hypothetical protein
MQIKTLLQTHKKSLRIQQHPASAFTSAITIATWAGQAQAGKTPQANTPQHYSTHSSVGTCMPARKLAPLHLANRCSICKEISSTQTHTQLLQGAIHKCGPRDTPWAGSLVSKQMQEHHCRLAEATVRLHREGYKAVAMWLLHSCICSPLQLVPCLWSEHVYSFVVAAHFILSQSDSAWAKR